MWEVKVAFALGFIGVVFALPAYFMALDLAKRLRDLEKKR
jgi:hypothetical protein